MKEIVQKSLKEHFKTIQTMHGPVSPCWSFLEASILPVEKHIFPMRNGKEQCKKLKDSTPNNPPSSLTAKFSEPHRQISGTLLKEYFISQ